MNLRARGLVGVLAALGLCACAAAPSTPVGTTASPSPVTPGSASSTVPSSMAGRSSSPTPEPAVDCLAAARRLGLDQQVALLYMGAITTASPDQAATQLAGQRTGSVILMADPGSASATSTLTTALHRADPGLLVAADQEGGEVQRLSGAGFTTIDPASEQAQLPLGTLGADWATWGGQLHSAGVDYDLAPVSDLVDASNVAANAPIGQLGRGYGHTRADVVANATAVIGGLHAAGEVTSVKHFPGLGNVSVNTDAGVAHDQVTTSDSPQVGVFADLAVHTDSVMVSSVVYDRIDPDHPAMFSSSIISGLLRGTLGFGKVVISDDLGAAGALAGYPVASRGTSFLRAGGDLALDVDPTSVPQMMADTEHAAGRDPAFAAQLPVKAARVLHLKATLGLAHCGS